MGAPRWRLTVIVSGTSPRIIVESERDYRGESDFHFNWLQQEVGELHCVASLLRVRSHLAVLDLTPGCDDQIVGDAVNDDPRIVQSLKGIAINRSFAASRMVVNQQRFDKSAQRPIASTGMPGHGWSSVTPSVRSQSPQTAPSAPITGLANNTQSCWKTRDGTRADAEPVEVGRFNKPSSVRRLVPDRRAQ
jgi:hypothetical protein